MRSENHTLKLYPRIYCKLPASPTIPAHTKNHRIDIKWNKHTAHGPWNPIITRKNRRDQRNQSRNPIVTQTPKKEKERSKKPFTQELSPTREKQSAPDFVRNLNEIAVKYRDWVFRNTIPQNQESQRPPSSSSEKYFLTPRRVRCTLPVIESKIL